MPPVTGIRDLAAALARVLVGTALTDPVAGVNVAAGTVIDTIAARFSGVASRRTTRLFGGWRGR